MTVQLELDLDGARARGEDHGDDLVAQLRALVAEPDMSDAEVEAAVRDALENMDWSAEERGVELRRYAESCRCDHGLPLANGWLDGEVTCCWCGRRPPASSDPQDR
jgi:hypothetical protein